MNASDALLIRQVITDFNSGTINPNRIQEVEARMPMGLNFSSIYHSLDANATCKLEGKRVLEIGGALPAPWLFEWLGVKSWTAVEAPLYEQLVPGGNQRSKWDETYNYHEYEYHLMTIEDFSRERIARHADKVLSDSDKYDIVYSVAAFEHITGLGQMLNLLAHVCKPECLLYSYFTPIWTAPKGYHCDTALPLPDYWHLSVTPSEAFHHFINKGLAPAEAEHQVYEIFKNPHINRLLPSEYLKLIEYSPWSQLIVNEINSRPIQDLPSQLRSNILRLNPAMHHLCDGYRLILRL